jgi:2-isopropylmalate synthase
MEIAQALADLGVDIIEAGFPISSPGDFAAVQAVSKNIKGPVIAGLARAIKADIDACRDALKPAKRSRIHVFLATSKIHMQYKFKKAEDEILRMAVEHVKYARNFSEDVEFSPEDASRTERKFLYKVVESVIKAGASTVNIPDTVGYSEPEEFGDLIRSIKVNVPNIEKAVISVHCHNDLGLATANSLAAVKNGCRQVECTVNGLGERAGNAALEEIIMGLSVRKDIFADIETNINKEQIYKVSRLVSSLTGIVIAPNKAIVGGNAFRHESGIHQDGVLKERTTYEIIDPAQVGFTGEGLVLGKHSGRHAFRNRLKALGFSMNDEQLEKAFGRFKDLADKKKNIYDEDLRIIVEDEITVAKLVWQLVSFKVTSGTGIKPRAEIQLKNKGKVFTGVSSGDGPADACFKAIDKVINSKAKLEDFRLEAVTSGKDALGKASLKLRVKEAVKTGNGSSTDIIEAAIKAYLDAINKIESK